MQLIVPVMVIALTLSSCYTRTVFVRAAIPLPAEPIWIKVSGSKLRCLDVDTFTKLVEREQQHLT